MKYERQGLRALFLFLVTAVAVHAGGVFAETNLLQNPEFLPDPANSAVPLGWNFSSFGTNTASPVYPALGPDASTTAVKVTLGSYTNGFADWYGSPVSVTPFAEYRYTDSYLSDATGIIEAQYTMPGGNVYTDLAYTSPTGGAWATADVTFSIPSGATSVTIFHLINGAGSLSIARPTLVKTADSQVFDQGMVTLTFDDGNQTQYDYARPILNSAGLPGTFYIAGQFMLSADQIGTSTGEIDNDYMNTDEVKQINSEGHEIGNHTFNHCNLLTGRCPDGDPANAPDPLDYIQEIEQGKSTLQATGVTPLDTIAYPYGAYNQDVKNVSASKGMIAGRGVDRGYNLKNTDKFALKIQYVNASSTTNADFQNNIKPWIDTAVTDKTWLVLLFHQIENQNVLGETHDSDATTPEVLQAVVDYLKQNNIKVVTLHTGVCMMTGMAGTSSCTQTPPATTTSATITLTNLTQTYDGTPKSASANTNPSGLPVSFTYDGSATSPTHAGSYSVIGTIESAQYTGSATGTLVISKAGQTISFAPVASHTLGDADFTITASSTSGLPVAFAVASQASSTCSVSGATVHLLTAGTCKIIGNQSGSTDYNPAPEAEVSFVVNPAGQPPTPTPTAPVLTIIGLNPATVTLGGTYLDPGATAFDAEDGDLTSHIISSSTVNTSALGTYLVTYTVTDSSGLSASAQRAVIVSENPSAPPTTGRITFCLVFADTNNTVATTSFGLPGGTFSIRLASSTIFDMSLVGSKSWDTLNFKPNVNLIVNGRTPDAQCRTIRHLPFGTYYYSELSHPDSAVWKTPRYNDEDTQPVNNVFDFFPYSLALFNGTPDDDVTRTLGSDGQIILDREHRDESVMIFQMFDRNATTTTSTDTATSTQNTGGQNSGGGEATTTPQTATTTPSTGGTGGGNTGGDSSSSAGGWTVVIGNGPPVVSNGGGNIKIPELPQVSLPAGVTSWEEYSSSNTEDNASYDTSQIWQVRNRLASSSPVRNLLNSEGNPLIDQVAGAAAAGKGLPKMFWYSTFFLAAILIVFGAWFNRRRRLAIQ